MALETYPPFALPSGGRALSPFAVSPGGFSPGRPRRLDYAAMRSSTLRPALFAALVPVLVLLVACDKPASGPSSKSGAGEPDREPDRVTVDHILVGVTGPRLQQVRRNPEQAGKLANKIMELLEGGADWDELRSKHSDDRQDGTPGGPYTMVNRKVLPRPGVREFPRDQMAGAFGDVGFGLEVGEIGLAEYSPDSSPFGYHIIKRLK